MDSSYPGGQFGENQQLDGSISLSPLRENPNSELHVSKSLTVHQNLF